MARFLVLNQPFFDGHPGVPGSPMHKVYTPEPGKWKDDIDPNMKCGVIVEVEDFRQINQPAHAFRLVMGMEPQNQSGFGTEVGDQSLFSLKMDNPKTGQQEWKHIWVIKLS